MDREGITTTEVSLGNPRLDPFDGPESPDLARALNAELAGYTAATDGRVVASTVVVSGLGGRALVRALARTGALSSFASGRSRV